LKWVLLITSITNIITKTKLKEMSQQRNQPKEEAQYYDDILTHEEVTAAAPPLQEDDTEAITDSAEEQMGVEETPGGGAAGSWVGAGLEVEESLGAEACVLGGDNTHFTRR
jgi:hypothetical protein